MPPRGTLKPGKWAGRQLHYPECFLSGPRSSNPLGALSPTWSLTWASPRTRNCRPRARGEHVEQTAPAAMPPGAEAARENPMETLYPRCAGIDVHKSNVVVCVRCGDRPGKPFEEVR